MSEGTRGASIRRRRGTPEPAFVRGRPFARGGAFVRGTRGFGCALLLALAAAGLAAEPIATRSVYADPLGIVQIGDSAGSVVVTGWPQPAVRLTGSTGRDVAGVRLLQRADGVSVSVVVPDGLKPNAEVGARLVVNAPYRGSLAVDSTSANQRVDGMQGPVSLSSVTGQLFVTGTVALGKRSDPSSDSGDPDPVPRAASSVRADTVSGRVLVYGQLPEVTAKTVGGPVELRGAFPTIDVETTEGEVRIVDTLVREGTVSSIAGAVYLWCRLAPGAHLTVHSLSGLVLVRLTPEAEPRITVTTYSGRLSVNRLFDRGKPVQVERAPAGGPMTMVIGKGTSTVAITDFSGDVILTNEPPPGRAK